MEVSVHAFMYVYAVVEIINISSLTDMQGLSIPLLDIVLQKEKRKLVRFLLVNASCSVHLQSRFFFSDFFFLYAYLIGFRLFLSFFVISLPFIVFTIHN